MATISDSWDVSKSLQILTGRKQCNIWQRETSSKLFLFVFPNMIFLLFIWEFHIMHPDHIHVLVLSYQISPCYLPPQKKRREKITEEQKFNLCCSCTHRSVVKLSVDNSLFFKKKCLFLCVPHIISHQFWRAMLQHA